MENNTQKLDDVTQALEILEEAASKMTSDVVLCFMGDRKFQLDMQEILQDVYVLMNIHKELTGSWPNLPNILRICKLLVGNGPWAGEKSENVLTPNMPPPKGVC